MVYIEIIHSAVTLGLVGYIYYLTKQQKQLTDFTSTELDIIKDNLEALIEDLNNHKNKTETEIKDLDKLLEYNSSIIDINFKKIVKDLPITIRKVIGHIEFARPLDKR
jgi:hypothetical protein